MKLCAAKPAWAVVAALSVAACAGIPTTHYYELRPATPREGAAAVSGNPHGLVVGVQRFQVDPPYDQDRIVYRVGEASPEIGFYAYHRWAVPLSRMLPVAVAEAWHGMAGIASIEPAVPGRAYDAYCEGRVLMLDELDLPEGQRVRVRLALALRLADGTTIWSETVGSESTASLNRVVEVVERMSLGLAEALSQARRGLGARLEERQRASRPGGPS